MNLWSSEENPYRNPPQNPYRPVHRAAVVHLLYQSSKGLRALDVELDGLGFKVLGSGALGLLDGICGVRIRASGLGIKVKG